MADWIEIDAGMDDAVTAHLRGLNERLDREIERANRRIGLHVQKAAKQIMQVQIYNVPIPLNLLSNATLSKKSKVRAATTKGKHGKWFRTGALKRSEGFRIIDGGSAVEMVNNAEYSAARDALGWGPDINPSGRRAGIQKPQRNLPDAERSKTRPVNWQRQAVEECEDLIQQELQTAVARALKLDEA